MAPICAVLIACSCFVTSVFAQGFAGLGGAADGYTMPQRGMAFSFPRDHGAHRGFRIEWWYLTSNLKSADGRNFGVQWTLFRSALAPPKKNATQPATVWKSTQLWMGHAAVTTKDKHHVAETRVRGGLDLAGVEVEPFRAWINDWQMRADPADNSSGSGSSSGNGIDGLQLNASGPEFNYQLKLRANGPLIFHGESGYSVKSANGSASAYYSQPFYSVAGDIELEGEKIVVTGSAWLDREWSSQPLDNQQEGWDWLSLNFDDGSKLMAFGLRQSGSTSYTSATHVAADGKVSAYGDGAVVLTPLTQSTVAGRQIPTGWRVKLKAQNINVEIAAQNPDAWMNTSIPYWEGPVTIAGSHAGRGYLEMTGYKPVK